MSNEKEVLNFLSAYDEEVITHALKLRKVILKLLPNIIEEVDQPAKMIMYSYGRKYSELICNIIPSKKGLKLGFNRGIDLHDPNKVLRGTGKISRYVEIKSVAQIESTTIKDLLKTGLDAYKQRVS